MSVVTFTKGVILVVVISLPFLTSCNNEQYIFTTSQRIKIDENEDAVVSKIELVKLFPEKNMVLISNTMSNRIMCWNYTSGKHLMNIELPIDISDSLFPVDTREERPSDYSFNRLKVSRHRFSWGNSKQWFQHRIKDFSFTVDKKYLLVAAEVKGVEITYNENRQAITGISGSPAIITFDFNKQNILNVTAQAQLVDTVLRIAFNRFWFSPSLENAISSIVCMKTYALNSGRLDWTLCKHDLKNNRNIFLAKRPYIPLKLNLGSLSGYTHVAWYNDSIFMYAHGSDRSIYDNNDRVVLDLPDAGEDVVKSDSNIYGSDNERLIVKPATIIRNLFFLKSDLLCVYYDVRSDDESTRINKLILYSFATKQVFVMEIPDEKDSKIIFVGPGSTVENIMVVRKTQDDIYIDFLGLKYNG